MEFIRGELFFQLADFIFNIKNGRDDYYNLDNTLNLDKLNSYQGIPIIYSHVQFVTQLFQLLKDFKKECVVISHNSDDNTPEIQIPDCVKIWYSQNVNFQHPKLQSLPIGLENSMWYKHIGKVDQIENKLKESKNHINLLYVNHNINTNKKERLEPYQIFSSKKWSTVVIGQNGQNFDHFIHNIYNHKFVLCPNGNGIDTHRLWETLYLKSIPIVKKGINTNFYQDLPICFVNNWKEINEEFLNNEWNRINNTQWDLKKLDFNYWKNIIKNGNK